MQSTIGKINSLVYQPNYSSFGFDGARTEKESPPLNLESAYQINFPKNAESTCKNDQSMAELGVPNYTAT